ncbi:trypsin-like serine peptidase [Rhodococcus yananensis]|uniref:trypsin-like serine peptidase n=1 Tax=Rhodococcus yananensis TaxID=2879464 RepID=UPI001CF85881|nr:trypsin-like serine protease [Rhodococcus yananensis]
MTITLDGAVAVTDPADETSPTDVAVAEQETAQAPPSSGPESGVADTASSGIELVAGYSGTPQPAGASLEELLARDVPDAAEATFGSAAEGQPSLESVIGVDDRIRITTTNVYPWRVHASLLIQLADGSYASGTGFFIGPRTVITAGHCVFVQGSGPRRGWVRSVTVMPGRNGSVLPYGSVTVSGSGIRSVVGWTQNGNSNWDVGALILPTELGSRTGWLGFGYYSDATLLASTANLAGYPGDKPSGTLWYHSRRLLSVSAGRIHYQVDTFGGQSGSAVYRLVDGHRYAFGIHTNGAAPGIPVNSGVRITKPIFDRMKAWKG